MWVIASALLVAACGGTDEAKRGVAEFRSRAAQKSYGEIYRTAGAELRQGATEEQFERFMTALDRRLGAWQSAAEPSWNVTRGTGGQFVRLTYQSQFAKGGASVFFQIVLPPDSPQRTQSKRERSTPAAASDSGSRESETSINAHASCRSVA